jgi:methionine biosynthesis protein MetW
MLSRFVQLLQRWGNIDEEYRRVVLSLFEPSPEARFLDVGCGDGEFALKVAERIGTRQVFGLDVARENVERAKARGIDCCEADLERKLPFEDESFDVVCVNQVIEHLSDTDALAKEVYRVLKPGGYAVTCTPNLAASHNVFFLLLGLQPPQTAVSDDFDLLVTSRRPKKRTDPWPTHRRLFTLEGLTAVFRWHGFSVVRTTGSGWYPLPLPLARWFAQIDKRHAAYLAISTRKNHPRVDEGP